MNEPLFQLGQQAVVNLGGENVPCYVFGCEPGDGARGFQGVAWVYHVYPADCDFGVNVRETDLQPPS